MKDAVWLKMPAYTISQYMNRIQSRDAIIRIQYIVMTESVQMGPPNCTHIQHTHVKYTC